MATYSITQENSPRVRIFSAPSKEDAIDTFCLVYAFAEGELRLNQLGAGRCKAITSIANTKNGTVYAAGYTNRIK